MSVVVGYVPDHSGPSALDLGLQLAHALGDGVGLTVVTVVPRQWSTPSLAKIDAEYAEYAQQVGRYAEEQARAYLTDTSISVGVDYRAVTGRSVAVALVDAATELDAAVLVLGSSQTGEVGRVAVGATADKLLHASPVPLAISPIQFSSVAAAGVSKVTCAFSDSESSARVVGRVAELATQFGVGFRVASFGVRGGTMFPPLGGISAEDSVLDSWAGQAERAQQELITRGVVPAGTERVIGTGAGWDEALSSVAWQPGELLALGSSGMGPLARVFLGSRATQLIRHAPVPVIVLPTG